MLRGGRIAPHRLGNVKFYLSTIISVTLSFSWISLVVSLTLVCVLLILKFSYTMFSSFFREERKGKGRKAGGEEKNVVFSSFFKEGK